MATVAQTDQNATEKEGVLISTQVSPEVKIEQRAIIDDNQAWRIFEKVERDNYERNRTDALLWNKYSGGQPFNQQSLDSTGQGNRYNFPTGFMSSIIDRVTPVPVGIIDSARFLTSASLCNINYDTKQIDPTKARKTEILRESLTKAIRRWPEWKTFCTGLCQELVLIGRAFVLFLDPYTPWPKFFRTDKAFLPNGTGEHARNIQILTAKQDLLVHELVNFVKNKQAAEDAGWDIDNCVKAINLAMPRQVNDDETSMGNERLYEDAIREGNIGISYSGASEVPIAHIFAVEANDVPGELNKVTQFILWRKGNHQQLFKKEDRFEKIEDVATLFTLEPGNGKFYGSKGLGRKLINPHLAIERARNRMFDQLEMSGMLILYTDASKAPTVQFKVRHPYILTTTDAQFADQELQANVKAYLDADAKMMDLAQQAVGQYLPNNLTNNEGEREKTAREVSVDYQREAEAKVAFLSRFWGQFADLISAMQRKLLDPETNDDTAKALQLELAEQGISAEEMKEFANAPAAEVVQDLTQIQNQQIIAVAAKYGGNPFINQRELMIRDITAMASPSIASDLVLPDQGVTTSVLEAARAQIIETESIMQGAEGMPVSDRDDHDTHLKVIIPDLQKAISGAQQIGIQPDGLGKIAVGQTHAQAHVQRWEAINGDPKIIQQYNKILAQIDQDLKKLSISVAQKQVQQQDQQAQAQQAQQQQASGQAPPQSVAKVLESFNYKDAPESIKRQIEQQLGFVPASDQEVAQQRAQEAVLRHPDLPEKVAAASSNQAPPLPTPAPPATIPAPSPTPPDPSATQPPPQLQIPPVMPSAVNPPTQVPDEFGS
jgi:hypothetical protein